MWISCECERLWIYSAHTSFLTNLVITYVRSAFKIGLGSVFASGVPSCSQPAFFYTWQSVSSGWLLIDWFLTGDGFTMFGVGRRKDTYMTYMTLHTWHNYYYWKKEEMATNSTAKSLPAERWVEELVLQL